MLDLIKAQYNSGRAMTQGFNWGIMQRGQPHNLLSDLYPWGIDYYHELNPYFMINIPRIELYNIAKIITVRDGILPFAASMVKNFAKLQNLETGFIINPELAPYLPPVFNDRSHTWRISQKKKLKLADAPNVLITGVMSDSVDLKVVKEKLQFLRQVRKDAKIELYLPIRKHPLISGWRETYVGYETLNLIKDTLPGRTLNFLTSTELLERTSFKDTYHYDLIDDNELFADKGLWHFIANRGGTVHGFEDAPAPNSVFDLELGFTHTLHVCPLPEVPNRFGELVFHFKLNPSTEPVYDSSFISLIRKK